MGCFVFKAFSWLVIEIVNGRYNLFGRRCCIRHLNGLQCDNAADLRILNLINSAH